MNTENTLWNFYGTFISLKWTGRFSPTMCIKPTKFGILVGQQFVFNDWRQVGSGGLQ